MYQLPEDSLITLKLKELDKIVEKATDQGRLNAFRDIKVHLGVSQNVSFDTLWSRLKLEDTDS